MRAHPHTLALGAAVLAAVGLFAAAFSAEEPLGSLRGRLLTDGGEQPLREVNVTVRPKDPKSGKDSHYLETDAKGEFRVDRLPAGVYEVEPLSTAHKNVTQTVTVEEGRLAGVELRLKPGDPYLTLNVHTHAFLPDDNPRVAIQGFRQGEAVRMRLLGVDDSQLLLDNGSGLRGLLTPVSRSGKRGAFRSLTGGKAKVLREWTHAVKNLNGEGVFYDFERLGRLKPGIYLVEAHGTDNNALGWLMVTDLALVTKSVDGNVLAYVTDLRTGAPRPGARLTFFNGRARLAGATTGGQGLAKLRLGTAPGMPVEAIAKLGSSLAYSRFYPNGYGGEPRRYRVLTYTDRPVYRPGHRIHFKGVVRVLNGASYSLPDAAPVRIQVTDEQGTGVYEGEVPMSARGTYHGSFELPDAALTGMYTIEATVGGETHPDTFAVAAYRKPEWRVEVETPRKSYVRREMVPVTIRANYYYGAPVVEAKVTYTVYRSQRWSYWDGEEEYAGEEGGFYGDVMHTGEGITDQDGALRFEFPTDQAPEEGWEGDYNYAIEAEVSDQSDRVATGSGIVRVSAGEVALEARSSRYVAAPGETVEFTVKARDLEDRPVPGVDVSAAVVLEKWDGRRAQEQELSRRSLRTGPEGEAALSVPLPQSGLVIVRLSTRDRRGNKVESSTSIWVSTADGGDFATHYPSLSIVPDKKLYKTGDTAQVLINTDRPGATALVAIEGHALLEYRSVLLKSRSTIVRFPIRKGCEPNVFVTACFVKNREFASSEARLNVNAGAHRLDVRIESDREVYHPGDTATFTIRTARAGKPQPAEVSFGLVDESVYAIREDEENALWKAFYPLRHNAVNTDFSYPSIYLGDADKDGGEVAVRRNFQDTAQWSPVLRTDSAGEATVSVRLPDNLTSWRATARGITDGTEVGERTFNILVQKELTLRLQVPRSLTEGDRFTISAVAHNYTQAPMDASVDLRASGLQVASGTRRVRLAPGAAERVEWEATAVHPGRAKVTATASGGQYSDGMELSVPIARFAREAVRYRTGAVTDTAAVEKFSLDPSAVEGELELRLAPTLAGPILSSLDYLATYPHGCTEQTMSSFLPDVVILRLMKDLELNKPSLEARLPEMTRAGLLRLQKYQHGDGGWGWWEYDDSEPWMTAYVLFGMQRARQSGVELNRRVWENGLGALKEQAKSATLKPDDGMFVAYVLAEAGQGEAARALLKRFEKQVEKLQRRSQGYRALALDALGDTARAQAAVKYLWTVAEGSGGLYHWEEKRPEWGYGFPQDVESTAVILKAALAATPDDPRLSGVARWLLLKRNGSRWASTRDTAFILYALADYLRKTGELKPDYRLDVTLNGRPLYSDRITPADASAEETVVTVKLPDLDRDGENTLEVKRSGVGTAYYAVKVSQSLKMAAFSPESTVRGLSLTREFFREETRRDGTGRLSNVAGDRPQTRFKIGDRILMRLTVHNAHPLEYVMLEVPLPAGCEVQDRGDLTFDEWRNSGYWWSHQDVRDDRINVFIRDMPVAQRNKPYVLEFYLRPEMVGSTRALPAVLSDMYNPALRASTSESRLEVRR